MRGSEFEFDLLAKIGKKMNVTMKSRLIFYTCLIILEK